ncbi:MAG: acetyl-CoA carboxylase subunit beta [Gemmatimonadetes bacterium RIFCSPLOWO2_02_FULL_71_11]|nr:MAG: acetyl-CoA carboxylase subunit beta [Gemmatimonadetes bacterium RIFCSPLOWO2_02_FULL_71_11]
MAWFRKDRRPRTSQRERLEIPADVWEKCGECGHVDVRENFARAFEVCPGCGNHKRVGAAVYISLLSDDDSFKPADTSLRSVDALTFDSYKDRLAASFKKAGTNDAIHTGSATLEGVPIQLGVMDFKFMGGSMGSVVGEKIARMAMRSLAQKESLVIVSASGGARMQEGVLSLMQLAKTSVVIAQLKEHGIPFVSIVTNPTTGGVSASYAMQGDVIIAEPGAVVGFAGPRVIKQTIGQDLPEGFQTAEFLLEHGMIDAVVPRSHLRSTTSRLVRLLLNQPGTDGVLAS